MSILPVIDSNIPQEMKVFDNWVLWKTEKRENGKINKIPYVLNSDKRASSTNPETWTDFDKACDIYKKTKNYAGIGFNLSNSPYVAIDIDHCINPDGSANEWAKKVINTLNSYTEISPSGTGVHIFIRDDKNEVTLEKKRNERIEIYKDGRFITMTGHIYNGKKEISTVGKPFHDLCQSELKGKERPPEIIRSCETVNKSDEDLLDIMSNSKHGNEFKKLYFDGDISAYQNDQSRADLALMNILCFYTQGDEKRMEELFTNSMLGRRDKWRTRKDYRERTIKKAIDDARAYYDPAYKDEQENELQRKAEELYKKHEYMKQDRKDFNERLPDELRQKEKGSLDIPKAYIFRNLNYPAVHRGNDEAKPITSDTANVAYLLKRMGLILKYNDITKKIEYDYVPQGITWELYQNETVAKLIKDIAYRNGLNISEKDLDTSLNVIAEQNEYNPVRDYLNEACERYTRKEDKEPIRKVFECIELDPRSNQDKEFCYTLFEKWLISAVVMAFNDNGDKTAQGVLIFKGKQGIGKTRFLYQILPNKEWGADGISIDTNNKDSMIIATSAWIVELGEFGETMKARQVDRLKSFITQGKDSYRVPYGKSYNTVPRRTIYMGTVNDDEFLKDSTGNRRYWVIAVKGFDFEALSKINLSEMWGQVMNLYRGNQKHYLTGREIQKLELQNTDYGERSEEEVLLLDTLKWEEPLTGWHYTSLSKLSEQLYEDDRSHNVKLGKALTKLKNSKSEPMKFIDKRRGGNGWLYLIPPILTYIRQ